MGTVASGISPDTAIYIPYETGIKYITGTNISPTITVIAEDVNQVDTVMTDVESALKRAIPIPHLPSAMPEARWRQPPLPMRL